MRDEKRQKIILVDDCHVSLTMGKSILEKHYDVYALHSAEKLFDILRKVTPDLILLDIEMPGMNGYDAITILKGNKRHEDIPVIFVTAKSSESDEYAGLTLGAIDYVTKPFSALLLLKRIENHLLIQRQRVELLGFNNNLIDMVMNKTRQVCGLQSAIITVVADLVEFRDVATGCHISRTQKYIERLIEQLMLEGVYMDELLSWDMDIKLPSTKLHDVGKISISDAILNKPGKLTPDEFEIMKTHVQKGVEAIGKMEGFGNFTEFLDHAKTFAGTHHEKWDGSGYPNGLEGENIPLEGRIMAIADVYDALISVRPYKDAYSTEEAARIIMEGSGVHFDPKLVDAFEKASDEFAAVAKEYRDEPNQSRRM